MPQTAGERAQYTFAQGLVTEQSPVNVVPGSALDMADYTINRDGSIRRRKGLQPESATVFALGAEADPATDAYAAYAWRGAAGDPDFVVQVIQSGMVLFFFTDGEILSDNLIASLDLTQSLVDISTLASARLEPFSFATGRGVLFVAGSYIDPTAVDMTPAGASYTVSSNRIDLQIRDFQGVDDGLGYTQRPKTLTTDHQYNLLNRGWNRTDWDQFFYDTGAYPASNMVPWMGYKRVNAVSTWDSYKLAKEFFGDSTAPTGRLFINPWNTATSVYITQGANTLAITDWEVTNQADPGDPIPASMDVSITVGAGHGITVSDTIPISISGNEAMALGTSGQLSNLSLDGVHSATATDATTLTFTMDNPLGSGFVWDDQFSAYGTIVEPYTTYSTVIPNIPNADFEQGDTAWTKGLGFSITNVSTGDRGHSPYEGAWYATWDESVGKATTPGTWRYLEIATKYQVTEGESIEASCRESRQGGTDSGFDDNIVLRWYDDDDVLVSETVGDGSSSTHAKSYRVFTVSGDCPAGATQVALAVRCRGTNDGGFGAFDNFVWNFTGTAQTVVTNVTSITKSGGYSTDRRPSAVAFWAGRLWFSGVPHPAVADTVFFTQLVEDASYYGKCYQKNDPTGRDFNTLLDTDGGTIKIPGLGGVLRKEELAGSLVVYAANGIWEIKGGQSGFSALSYQSRKIADFEVTSKQGFAKMDSTHVVATKRGLVGMQYDTNSGYLSASNLTAAKINRYWHGLSTAARAKCSMAYDDAKHLLHCKVGTKDLILDTVLKAYYVHNLPSECLGVLCVDAADDALVDNKTKYVTIAASGEAVAMLLHFDELGEYDSGSPPEDSAEVPTTFSISNPSSSLQSQAPLKKFGAGGLFAHSASQLSMSAPAFQFADAVEGWSVDAWVRVDNLTVANYILRQPSNGWYFGIDTTGHLTLVDANGTLASSSTISANTWTHVAVSTWYDEIEDTETTRLFINGTKVAEAAYFSLFASATNMTIAVSGSEGGMYLDELRVLLDPPGGVYIADFTPPTEAYAAGTYIGIYDRNTELFTDSGVDDEVIPFVTAAHDNTGESQENGNWAPRKNVSNFLYAFLGQTGADSSTFVRAQWDWAVSSTMGKWSTPQQLYRPRKGRAFTAPDTIASSSVVATRNKIRGTGQALQLHFYGEEGKDSHILGWHTEYGLGRPNNGGA